LGKLCISLLENVFVFLILVPGSSEYVHLETDLSSPSFTTYQKRNYNPKSPLLLDGLIPRGFTTDNNDLRFVVGRDEATNELYVLTLGVKSTTR
jgi:hypothetical protein